LRSVALRFVLSQDRVTSAVLGPRNMQQLDQLIRDAGRAPPYMSAETSSDLERALEAYGVTGE
jgi:aryl-alcohol dehydrogenase-like predicted oxidoreductase